MMNPSDTVAWINSAVEDYFYITIRYVLSQTVAVLLLFILVRSSDDISQYAFVSVFGGILANLLNIFHIRKQLGIYPKLAFSHALIKHIRPIFYLFACTIATFIYINSDVTILRIFASDASVGYYGVSTQFYQLVKQLINAAFIVVVPRISNELANDESKAFERYNKILVITILLLIPCSIGLFMIRRNLVLLFSGSEYAQASSSLAILAIAIIPAMLANFYINIVMIPLKMEKQVMIATVVSALVNIGLNFVLIPKYAENAAAFTTLLAEMTIVVIAAAFCRSIKMSGMGKPIIAGIVGGIPIMLICYFINHSIYNYFFNIVLCVLLSALAYGIVIFTFYRKDIATVIRKTRSGVLSKNGSSI